MTATEPGKRRTSAAAQEPRDLPAAKIELATIRVAIDEMEQQLEPANEAEMRQARGGGYERWLRQATDALRVRRRRAAFLEAWIDANKAAEPCPGYGSLLGLYRAVREWIDGSEEHEEREWEAVEGAMAGVEDALVTAGALEIRGVRP